MISKEQVADLREGDVVEIADSDYPGVVVRGPLSVNDEGYLMVGDYVIVRRPDGSAFMGDNLTLTVVSRVPRPLYVNHPRTEPVPGDVVRDADGGDPADVWVRAWGGAQPAWLFTNRGFLWGDDEMPKRLRLLVDGETGQVVP